VVATQPRAEFTLREDSSLPIDGVAPAVFTQMPPGHYTLSWKSAGGLLPAESEVTIPPGGSVTLCGAFGPMPPQCPPPPEVIKVTSNAIRLRLQSAEPDVLLALQCIAVDPPAAGLAAQQWIGPCGEASPVPVWLPVQQWQNAIIAPVQRLTAYTFAAATRGGGGAESALGSALTVRTTVSGDANGDCQVNIMDLLVIRPQLGLDPCTSPAASHADLNGDHKVDLLDLLICRNHMGGRCP